ncbi:MAG: hypothetical protein COU22_02730 [Candidatus Komeilibacteria bacterium CG10_big_fil_rev_8_21_14_0_10_41_13]|uniref:TGS domain-containing protein n=1 Tax=Candidatus Komeilibacteria bacterium CG10_big_fil_rev_8_21_14_0_10_41_13 TaxID=1974476 RepID=A0A2M6WC03_9BACT|nr:MAG: hypothetical protein COU22_02730 [Candidatus Komeilibacteria bacterium CG10_big_fil_rev_8_21_14_0_10_41_13]
MIITIEDIIKQIKGYNPKVDAKLLWDAYEFSRQAHLNNFRLTGENFIHHCLATAYYLANMRLDTEAIAAGLLHDVIDDSSITTENLTKRFGKEIARLVENVSKLGQIKYRGEEKYAENLRKMFVAIATDIRVILIKFAERQHNLKTLEALPPEQRRMVALESLKIYAPIASRLGMGNVNNILSDLAFPYAYPKEYSWVKNLSESRLRVETKYTQKIQKIIEADMAKEKIGYSVISGRFKNLYSLYQKLLEKNRDINKIYDLIAVRIVANNIADCYRILGLIHKKWTPLKSRIKDYISQPKPNGYQSLHTTVFTDRGKIVEFQIRDQKMHEVAEYGIAAHWRYKEMAHNVWSRSRDEWLRGLGKVYKNTIGNNKDYLGKITVDIFNNRIFVYTPKGDVIDLPIKSTPVDFAYRIHSDIGDKCVGAIVNDQISPLDKRLKNLDVVEILTNKNRLYPNEDWLDFVQTNLARERIKQVLRKKQQVKNKKLL